MNKKMIVKNSTTNQHYSLAEKTLILLSSLSNENMILHGLEAGKEVQLDVPFNKMKFIQDESEILGEGKVFTHALDMSKVKVNKITEVYSGEYAGKSCFLIYSNGVYKYYTTKWNDLGFTVAEQDYLYYGMSDLSIIPESAWNELTGLVEIHHYTDDLEKEDSVIIIETEPYSVYDYISETPEVLVYTELDDDITVETTTEPFYIYDEFGDSVDVLYYTDDESVNETDLILEANWSPLDELEGDFEVVTWTDESADTAQRVLEITAVPKPQFVKMVEKKRIFDLKDIILSELAESIYNNSPVRYLVSSDEEKWMKFNIETNSFIEVDTSTLESIKTNGMTYEEINNITEEQWAKFEGEYINIGIYLEDDIRDTVKSIVNKIEMKDFVPKNTSSLSNTSFYILNTTARIDVELNNSLVTGTLSDDDLTRVQYRVILNGKNYYPTDGSFTSLQKPPYNISLEFSSNEININEPNTVRIEFQDFFGTTDYWETTFIGTYSGLLFTDTNGDYYSNEIGEVIKNLDFGIIIAGQTTMEHEIRLQNKYGYDVENARIDISGELPDGMFVELSKTATPFIPNESLLFNKLENDEEVSFFIRLRTTLGATPSEHGKFDIVVRADKVS